jgi:redox-sensitive bicupin YhaK (pirin superfamily)
MSNLDPDPAETAVSSGVGSVGTVGSVGSVGSVGTIGTEWVDVLVGRDVPLGKFTTVNRLLPHTNRRMVGAWCFLDHFGPDALFNTPGMQVPPHPHCGLQTVTWLLNGEVLHRDSLDNLAMIRPGQLNLMTAGRGIAHSEESPDGHGPSLHGLQLWIALPTGTGAGGADGAARFEHHDDLPVYEVDGAHVTVVIGELFARRSSAQVHTPIVGADLRLEAGAHLTVPLRSDFEYAVLAMAGGAEISHPPLVRGEGDTDPSVPVAPGALLYLGEGRTGLDFRSDAGGRLFLLGGEPFADELVMWWNFVGRSHDEIVTARETWQAEIVGSPRDEPARFGSVHGYRGEPLPAPAMPTTRLKPRDRRGRGGR